MTRFPLRDCMRSLIFTHFYGISQKLYLSQNKVFSLTYVSVECQCVISSEVQQEHLLNSNSHIKMSMGVGFVLSHD